MKQRNNIQPPRWPVYILRLFVNAAWLEEIEGDLLEVFNNNLSRYPAGKAKWLYIIETLGLVRPALMRELSIPNYRKQIPMFKNYLKIAFRNIVRHKAYSAINIAGLAIGMASSIIIMLWVYHERSYDTFHKNAGHLYRLTCSAGDFKAAVSPAGMVEGLQAAMPEIEAVTRISKQSATLLEAGNNKFEEKNVFFADSNFLQFFSFPLVQGNKQTALNSPGRAVITANTALKYFGTTDAVGKILRVNNRENFSVTGVLANLPSNSHLQFDMLFSMASISHTDADLRDKVWDKFNYYSYIQFKPVLTPQHTSQLLSRIQQLYVSHHTGNKIDFQLQPVIAIHLQPGLQIDLPGKGNSQYVNLFFVVALLVITVACINFMNLSTARASARAKEVGMRKVAGARRAQLVLQFLGESLIVSFVSLFTALAIVWLLMPLFNNLAEKHIEVDVSNPQLWFSLGAIAIITGIVSGSYPAFLLSAFNPIKVLKGKNIPGNNHSFFRNSLVVVQFSVAIILLAGTAVVYQQLNYLRTKNLGFDKSNLLYFTMTGDLWGKQAALKDELAKNPLTSQYAVVSDLPTAIISGTINVQWEGRDPNSQVVIPSMDVDENFSAIFKTEMLAGRSFSKAFKTDSFNYVINEKAMKLMGFNANNAVGKNLSFGGDKGIIIGVVKDFNFKSLQYSIEPLVLRFNRWGGNVVVRTQPGSTEACIKTLEKITKELNPAYPFNYSFLDKDLENHYKSEQQMGKIFNLFTVLAIFISCLGLYGLSAYMAEQRTREIGVRKVLGASLFGIVYLLSKNFTRLILVAILIAVPVAWIGINSWLSNFAYRAEISWPIFAIASFTALVIAWCTMSYESVKAGIANPAKSLRSQ